MAHMAAVPRIAVILPVYNAERYVAEAIRSVLDQTFADFHLIVIDDGSTDRSGAIIDACLDPRMRVIRFPVNRGLVTALNTAISQSQSEFIARMDADDVCMPRRFARQVAFLEANPKVVLCGTWTRQFGDTTRVYRPPVAPPQVRARLFFTSAMDHPSIMMRRSFLERHGLAYDEAFRHVEDFDLFFRAAALGDLANVPEVLLRTRAHDQETSVVHAEEQTHTEARLRVRQLRLLMPEASGEEESFHVAMINSTIAAADLPIAERWLVRLKDANRARPLFETGAFERELRRQLYRLHVDTGALGMAELAAYCASPLVDGYGNCVRDVAGLLYRAARRGGSRN